MNKIQARHVAMGSHFKQGQSQDPKDEEKTWVRPTSGKWGMGYIKEGFTEMQEKSSLSQVLKYEWTWPALMGFKVK